MGYVTCPSTNYGGIKYVLTFGSDGNDYIASTSVVICNLAKNEFTRSLTHINQLLLTIMKTAKISGNTSAIAAANT